MAADDFAPAFAAVMLSKPLSSFAVTALVSMFEFKSNCRSSIFEVKSV